MGIRDRLRSIFIPPLGPGVDNWWPGVSFGGNLYQLDNLNLTMPGGREEEIESNFGSYVQQAYKRNGVVFACMLARLMIFSEARFQFRTLRKGRPGDLFGNQSLDILETPWPNGTTGDLLARIITDADMAGNWYGTRRNNQIKRMRPDWVTMVHGTADPDTSADDLDAEFLGIIYYPGGEYTPTGRPVFLQRSEIAHYAPIPDPLARSRGMSWLTPIVREVMGDSASTTHKLKIFENGATPQMIVKRPDAPDKEKFTEWWKLMEEGHAGLANAYKTFYLTAGADATVVGKDLQQMDFKVVQGAGETRIAAASGVHPVVVGLSEGMQGASLNAGNFNSARRLTADKTFRPLWRNLAGSLQTLVPPPPGSQLWYDDRDIAFLREDRKDAAEIQQIKAASMRNLVDGGWTPDSIVAYIQTEDASLLKHSGLFSVQLQPPMPDGPPKPEPVVPVQPSNGRHAEELVAASESRLYQALARLTPPSVTIAEGAVRNEIHTPEVTVNMPEQEPPVVNVTVPERIVEAAVVNVTVPEQPAPNVTVEAPQITVNVPEQPAPQVTVEAPPPAEVTVNVEQEPPVVNVNLPEQKSSRKTVKRDTAGRITEVVEE